MLGKKEWVIPDGYMSEVSNGSQPSHEAVCVLNLGDTDAQIKLTIFFEDKEPLTGFTAECKAKRTNHIRLDKITNDNNEAIPHGIPYAIYVESTDPIVVQHSRLDTTQAEMALMTTIAY